MNEIQTYNAYELIQGKKHREEVVLKADHLAEVEQWKRIIVTHVDVIAEKDAHIKELEADEEKQRTKKEYYHEEHAKELNLRVALEQRIKELEGALEKIFNLCSGYGDIAGIVAKIAKAALQDRIKELEAIPRYGNDEVARIKEQYRQYVKELTEALEKIVDLCAVRKDYLAVEIGSIAKAALEVK
jgi:hypothetical protein